MRKGVSAEFSTLLNQQLSESSFPYDFDLKEIKEEAFPGVADGYSSMFSCEFDDGGVKVLLIGDIGFDKYGHIANLPQSYGSNKIAVSLHSVVVDAVIDSVPLSSKYNLACFASNPSKDATSWTHAIVSPHDVERSARDKACASLKSMGAEDAYFDDDLYLVYVVAPSSLSATPNEVARATYELYSDVPTISGVRVVSSLNGEKIGEFSK